MWLLSQNAEKVNLKELATIFKSLIIHTCRNIFWRRATQASVIRNPANIWNIIFVLFWLWIWLFQLNGLSKTKELDNFHTDNISFFLTFYGIKPLAYWVMWPDCKQSEIQSKQVLNSVFICKCLCKESACIQFYFPPFGFICPHVWRTQSVRYTNVEESSRHWTHKLRGNICLNKISIAKEMTKWNEDVDANSINLFLIDFNSSRFE